MAGDETHGVVYLNDGKGVFYNGPVGDCAASPANFGCFGASRTDAVALADVNGDGTLDIIAGSNLSADEGTQSAVYLNDGAGRFRHGQVERLRPAWERERCCGASGANDAAALIGRVAAGDLNGDGRPDLVVAYRGGDNAVYLNSDQGVFSAANSFDAQVAPTRNMALDEISAVR